MKLLSLVLTLVVLLTGCVDFNLVGDYDEVLDQEITEFAEQFNTHVKIMADFAGTPQGTDEANIATYNALEAKLNVILKVLKDTFACIIVGVL